LETDKEKKEDKKFSSKSDKLTREQKKAEKNKKLKRTN
jgi:hypothetical protein